MQRIADQVTVIITVYNEELTVAELIRALNDQSVHPTEIIVVDGGSTDTTLAVLQSLPSLVPLRIATHQGNRSCGRNYACTLARTNLIACTDAGCIPDTAWLSELMRTQHETRAEVVAGYYAPVITTPFTEASSAYTLVMPDRVDPDNFLPATRSMLFTKDAWKKVGGFDESLDDNEDYAFAHQLLKQKITRAFARHAVVQWKPRVTLSSFAWMIVRFARGDIYSGILRPKVIALFGRIILFCMLVVVLGYTYSITAAVGVTVASMFLYSVWAIIKNIRYCPRGWYWLPVLQYVSDGAVFAGSIWGAVKRVSGK